jgi:hypothetical protein
VMALLIERRRDEVIVTEEVVRAAATNRQSGEAVMTLLLERRVEGFDITQGLVKEVARSFRAKAMALLKRRRIQGVVAEVEVRAASGNRWSDEEVIELLLKQRVDDLDITQGLATEMAQSFGAPFKTWHNHLEQGLWHSFRKQLT